MWVFAGLIVLAMGGIAMVAAGRGEPMGPAYDDRPDARVPLDRPVTGDDLRRVRFSLAFRGYRMSEVDALLARLAHEQEQRAAGPVDHPTPDRRPYLPPAPATAAPVAMPDPQPAVEPDRRPGRRFGRRAGRHSGRHAAAPEE
ncbi:cell division protein DivIVA [Nocardioides silvaticus]|uniref:Cell division protein DivIVA n=2 Tax=Nocardioides silvaticus TaxID=2201891 RepID=A0A316TER3_9ACTN|nr:cell division protein DivIVA [Nocardioides silvaticus]